MLTLYKRKNVDFFLLSSGDYQGNISGFKIVSDNNSGTINSIGQFSNYWDKKFFTIFKGKLSITIDNEIYFYDMDNQILYVKDCSRTSRSIFLLNVNLKNKTIFYKYYRRSKFQDIKNLKCPENFKIEMIFN